MRSVTGFTSTADGPKPTGTVATTLAGVGWDWLFEDAEPPQPLRHHNAMSSGNTSRIKRLFRISCPCRSLDATSQTTFRARSLRDVSFYLPNIATELTID